MIFKSEFNIILNT